VVTDNDVHFRFFKLDAQGHQSTLDAAQLSREFAQAVCRCQDTYVVEVFLSANVAAQVGPLNGHFELWAGTNCGDQSSTTQPLEQRCSDLLHGSTIPISRFTQAQSFGAAPYPPLTADQFLITAGVPTFQSCTAQTSSPSIWALFDENNDKMFEGKQHLDLAYDGLPPTEPVNFHASGGSEAVELSWDIPTTGTADTDGFQVVCVRGADLQVFPTGSFKAGYKTTGTECAGRMPLPVPTSTEPPDAGVPDAGSGLGVDAAASAIAAPPQAGVDAGGVPLGSSEGTAIPPFGPFLADGPTFLDPRYVCSERLAKTVRNTRIQGLQNGIPYSFAVVTIDKVGNPSPITSVQLVYPTLSEDAYRHYREEGGQATGGFCAVAIGSRVGRWALVPLGLAAALAWLVRRRRRARAQLLVGALALVPRAARADEPIGGRPMGGGDVEAAHAQARPSGQHWAAELRFGPYRPDVDSEFNGAHHPYAEFFGTGASPLFGFELDRQLWHGYGSLGVGAAVSWFSDSAHACRPSTCDAPRVTADESSINMIPIALLAVYRFDVPALRWNIPIVPYAKFGLAYNIWWITNASGDVASFVPTGGQSQSASGGTFGYVGAVGGAILLDWLDPEAAVALDAELGINHTYVFFEYYSASVNGGSQSLHVGDTTWALGLAFEF
jgi:hypothetical protein